MYISRHVMSFVDMKYRFVKQPPATFCLAVTNSKTPKVRAQQRANGTKDYCLVMVGNVMDANVHAVLDLWRLLRLNSGWLVVAVDTDLGDFRVTTVACRY